MGSVWLAHDTSLDTPCAIKFIHGEAAQSAQMRGRFEREAKSAAQLRSPNVVQILDHGVSDGTPYIAMEYLEGEDLEQRLRRLGRLSPEDTLAIISQVAKALTRASAAKLVHRDLKPANIFLVRDEDHDVAKVVDFGVAKSNMPALDGTTKIGAVLGTPYYMSPEQTRGTKDIDHRSDLWALAVIVFQCVTGRLPFVSDSLGDLFFRIAGDPLPVPSSVAPDLPPGFDAWWARAAMRDPAQRYQTAREMVDALAAAFRWGLPAGSAAAAVSMRAPGSQLPPSVAPAATTMQTDGGTQILDDPGWQPRSAPPPPSVPAAAEQLGVQGSHAGLSVSGTGRPAGGSRSAAILAFAVLSAGGIGWAAYARLGTHGAASGVELPVPAVPTVVAPTSAAVVPSIELVVPVERRVLLAIEPANAKVEVDGHETPVKDGSIEVLGAIGSSHRVRLRLGASETLGDVAVAESGAVPSRLTLVTAARQPSAGAVAPRVPVSSATKPSNREMTRRFE